MVYYDVIVTNSEDHNEKSYKVVMNVTGDIVGSIHGETINEVCDKLLSSNASPMSNYAYMDIRGFGLAAYEYLAKFGCKNLAGCVPTAIKYGDET